MFSSSCIITLAFFISFASSLNAGDEAALDALFDANPGNLLGWTSSTDYCNQVNIPPVVICNPAQTDVIWLDLDYTNLATIPVEFWNLPLLEYLSMNKHGIVGSLPPEINQLTSIQYLWITRTALSGPLPTEIGQLTTLIDLQLQSNDFTGSLPSTMQSLTALVFLKLSGNMFDGPLPSWLGSLVNLVDFVIYQNDFIGNIPASWANLTLLQSLVMHDNSITGGFPPEFQAHPRLARVTLDQNLMSGSLWDGWDTLVNLQDTGLIAGFSDNDFTGFIPTSFGRIGAAVAPSAAGLHRLYLAGNDWYCPLTDISPWAWTTDWRDLQHEKCLSAPTEPPTIAPTGEPSLAPTLVPTDVPTPPPAFNGPCVPLYDFEIGCDGVRIYNFRIPPAGPFDPPGCENNTPIQWCVNYFFSPGNSISSAVDECVDIVGDPTAEQFFLGPVPVTSNVVMVRVFSYSSVARSKLPEFTYPDGYFRIDANAKCFITPLPTPLPTPAPTPAPTKDACAIIPGWQSRALSTSFEPEFIHTLSGFQPGTDVLDIALNISTKYIDAAVNFQDQACSIPQCMTAGEYTTAVQDALSDGYWTVHEDVFCWHTTTLSIPWSELYNFDGATDSGVGGLTRSEDLISNTIRYEGKLYITMHEWLGYLDNKPITRTVISELTYVVVFPTHVDATLTEPLRVFYDIVALSAVIDQIVFSSGAEVHADLIVFTSVQWPFRLIDTGNPPLTIVAASGITGSTTLTQDCVEPANVDFADGVQDANACGQQWTVALNLNGNCEIDGNYTLEFQAECHPGMVDDCPLDGAETIIVEFSVDSEDTCAQVIEEVDISADLTPYRDIGHFIEADDFFQGRRVYMVVAAVSAYASVSTTTISQITLQKMEGMVVTTWDLLNPDQTISADGNDFGLSVNDNPAILLGEASQSWFDFVLDIDLLAIPFDWSASLYVTVQLDVEFAGAGKKLLERTELYGVDPRLFSIPEQQALRIQDSFHIVSRPAPQIDDNQPSDQDGSLPKSSAPRGLSSHRGFTILVFLFTVYIFCGMML